MKTKLPKTVSNLEAELMAKMKYVGLPEPVREFVFCATRKWRFDFCWPAFNIAAEVEGGVWTSGRHVRGQGFIGDCEKYNRAAMNGWCVLRFTEKSVKDNTALDMIEEALRDRGWKG